MAKSLKIYAGEAALEEVRQRGLEASRVRVVVGASGGPKWLSLSRLDRVVFEFLDGPRPTPLFLLGSSIGSWRMSCLARRNPARMIAEFEDYYTSFEWGDERLSAAEVTSATRVTIEALTGGEGATEIMSNPHMRLSIMAVRSRGLLATEQRAVLATALAAVAAGNALSRRTLGLFFERALFSDPRDVPPFAGSAGYGGFPIRLIPLGVENCTDAVLAASAIPLVMTGVSGISGAPSGVYRDGGFIDYHFDLPFLGQDDGRENDGIVLYPHYRPRLIPGWFDKPFKNRRPAAENLKNVLMLAPSGEFIDSLSGGKLPDRSDFKRYTSPERTRIWRDVANQSQRLADEFRDLLSTGRLGERAEPFPF